VLDAYLAYQPGCTAANGWCHAPEHAYPLTIDGCAMHGRKVHGIGLGGGSALAAIGLALRRRRRRALASVAALVMAQGTLARAADGTGDAAPTCPPTQPPAPAAPPRFGAYVAYGASLDNTAMNVSGGGRLWLTPGWETGLDVEFNPWFSTLTAGARPGALNVYGTLIRRWPPFTKSFGLRSTIHLGTSTILFDLYGVPRYTTGIYLGANLLGAEWKVGRSFIVVLDPADVALPAPQLAGTPFGYLQYRITVGLQWGA